MNTKIFLGIILSLLCASCTIGIKQNNTTVLHDPIPFPESAKGTPRIATNRKVPIAIDGVKDKTFLKDVGGYVVVTPLWYAELIRNWNKNHGEK